MIKIADAEFQHLPEILRIERDSFSDSWPVEAFTDFLGGRDRVFIGAFAESELTGFAMMSYVLDEGHIMNIAVKKAYRCQGIGGMLTAELIQRASGSGILYMYLEVREGNHAARAMYGRFGFIEVGKRRGYYERPAEDAVLMTKFLT